jgi:hypothetical protein
MADCKFKLKAILRRRHQALQQLAFRQGLVVDSNKFFLYFAESLVEWGSPTFLYLLEEDSAGRPLRSTSAGHR